MKPKTMAWVSGLTLLIAIATLWMVWQMQSQMAHTDADASEIATASCVSKGTVKFTNRKDTLGYCVVKVLSRYHATLTAVDGSLVGAIPNVKAGATPMDLIALQGTIVYRTLYPKPIDVGGYQVNGGTVVQPPLGPGNNPTPEVCSALRGQLVGGVCFFHGDTDPHHIWVWGADGSITIYS